jgi:flagellar basal body-associated protein FliL
LIIGLLEGNIGMSDKAEKKPDAGKDKKEEPGKGKEAAAAPAGGGGGLMTKLPVLMGAAMVLEAVVLFAGFKFLGSGAKNANAADLTMETKKDAQEASAAETAKNGAVEIQLLDSRFPNKQSGKTFLYDVAIFVSVKPESAESVKKIITDRDALIKDRVRTIIAQSDPDKLGGGSEPGLETLRRQVKYQLDTIIGDGLVDEVLVPRCIPFRTDY